MKKNVFVFAGMMTLLLLAFLGCDPEADVQPETLKEPKQASNVPINGPLVSSYKGNFAAGVYTLSQVYQEKIEITYDVRANKNNVDGVMGWGANTTLDGYQDFAMVVRMQSGGYFDVYNGSGYSSDQQLAYQGGVAYQVKIVADIPGQVYDVWVNGQQIASNYAFRATAISKENIAKLGLIAGYEGEQISVSNLTISVKNEGVVYRSKPGFTGVYNLGAVYTGKVQMEYDVVAKKAEMDGVMGWAGDNVTVTGYNGFSAIVRMNNSGYFDVRNGSGYKNDVAVPYSPGVSCHVKVIANIPAQVYDVWVNNQKIATNYQFRTDAVSKKNFAQLGLETEQFDELAVQNLVIETLDDNNPTPDSKDIFGIQKLYPDKANGESWFISDGFEGANRIKISGSVRKSGDSWIGAPNSKSTFRVAVEVKEGFNDAKAQPRAENHALLTREGYMQESHDWKNVEMTGYFKIEDIQDDSEEITLYARGGRHSSNFTKQQCQGTAYKLSVRYNGNAKLAKEMHHDGGAGYVNRSVNEKFSVGSIEGKWIGVKAVMYNVLDSNGNVRAVKMKLFLDTTPDNLNDPWQLWFDSEDAGNWAGKQFVVDNCRALAANEMIVWGGPTATFRIDDANKVSFKNLSIREIQPPVE